MRPRISPRAFLRIAERELLDNFDPKKSRLRTYLRICVDSFVMNEDKAGRRQSAAEASRTSRLISRPRKTNSAPR